MLEYIYNTIREDSARKEMMMIKNKEKREEKKQQLKKKIIETRAKELNCKLENIDGKGEVAVSTWNGKTVGEYLGPGLLSPTLNKFRHNLFNIEQLERMTKKQLQQKHLLYMKDDHFGVLVVWMIYQRENLKDM